MLKMRGKGTKNGKPIDFIVLGLSHENLRRLKQGQPIKIEGEQFNLPGFEFLIFSGKDERTMGREFAELVGPDTVVHIDPRLRD